MEIVFTLATLPEAAARLLDQVKEGGVIALHGEMGTGKTTFSTAFCKALGVTGTVNSPTFSLVNEYRTPAGKTIYHMDWYRLRDEAEAVQAGMEEYLYSGALCLVEWPERAPGILPPGTRHVLLEVVDAQTRRLTLGPVQ